MDKMQSVKKVFKTGGDFNFPVLLWDVNVETNVKTAVDLTANHLTISCSIFDRQNRKLADAVVEQIPTIPNAVIIKVDNEVTKLWKASEDAKFDLKIVNSETDDVRYSQTVYFDIERGLS